MLHRLVLAALLGTLALPAGARERLVLVPFERVARSSASRDVLMPALAAALLAKGYDVVAGPDVEEFLRKRRIRWLDSLTPARTAELLSTFDAGGAVLGTILSWAPDRIDPEVAVAARVLGRDGTVLWSDLAGLSISETEGALGLGKARGMDELARRAVDRLVAALPARKLAPVRVARSAGLEKLPRVFRDRDRIGARLRICVLPLENHTGDRDPPRVLDAVLQHRLAERTDLTPVPAAELRDALGKTGVHVPAQYLTLEQLRELGKTVGTPLFLRGAIYGWGIAPDAAGTPAVEIYLTLVDVESGRTVWSGMHRRTGQDYEGPLLRGAVRDETSLASRVVGELLEAFMRL